MKLELNIGLWLNGKPNANFGAGTALRETVAVLGAEMTGTLSCSIQTALSGEDTAVVTLEIRAITLRGLERYVTFLCRLLGQDCIAGKLDGVGFLFGPNTALYGGAFDEQYWLTPRC